MDFHMAIMLLIVFLGIIVFAWLCTRFPPAWRYPVALLLLIVGFSFIYKALGPLTFTYESDAVGGNGPTLALLKEFGISPVDYNRDELARYLEGDRSQVTALRDSLLNCQVLDCECTRWEFYDIKVATCAEYRYFNRPYRANPLTAPSWVKVVASYIEWRAKKTVSNKVCEAPDQYVWTIVLSEVLEDKEKLREKLALKGDLSYWDYLYFSIVSVTTTGYGDITPATTEARLYVSGEIVLGMVIFGGLLHYLARRRRE